jgi:hypothetical protein
MRGILPPEYNEAMATSLEIEIEEERARIGKLDAKLDNDRTPVYKERLLFACHLLDDARSCGDTAFAADCLQRAILKRKEVEQAFSILDPAKAMEIGS